MFRVTLPWLLMLAACREGTTPSSLPPSKTPTPPKQVSDTGIEKPDAAVAGNAKSGATVGGEAQCWVARASLFAQKKFFPIPVEGTATLADGRHGMRVQGIAPASGLGRCDIKDGDLLLAVNGVALDSPTHALSALERLKSSSICELTLHRNGKTFAVYIHLH